MRNALHVAGEPGVVADSPFRWPGWNRRVAHNHVRKRPTCYLCGGLLNGRQPLCRDIVRKSALDDHIAILSWILCQYPPQLAHPRRRQPDIVGLKMRVAEGVL